MSETIELKTSPEIGFSDQLESFIVTTLKLPSPNHYKILKRSVDARRKPVHVLLRVEFDRSNEMDQTIPPFVAKPIESEQVIHIIGAGPAGLFAGLRAIESGIKPIIYERGKRVKERRRDLALINKEGIVNPDSNYCFGEGGAGTYSDGKLYTRSKKRGHVQDVLLKLVQFGAPENILYDAQPHIGTNKLPQIIEQIRETILNNGGEVHFESKLTDILFENDQITGFEVNGNEKIKSSNIILATGHSARDIFELLHRKQIEIEFKPFALGVRIEHQQSLIDKIQYKMEDRGEFLPPSSYRIVTQVNGRGVYSFCMCPGGIVAPCATESGEVVTNGWSPSKRNNPWSNSGIVTEVRYDDIKDFHHFGPLAGLEFQKSVEQACCEAAGKTQAVPAQRMLDFMKGITSETLPDSSYIPGRTSVNLAEVLPHFVTRSIQLAFKDFEKKMRGYSTNEAIIHAPESRTSSPVRIPRDKETMQHTTLKGLYPCAEGAGYAGGIVSAAIDGMKCVEAISDL
ncbi:MAG: FAD-binding protein [Flavobacteriales bacterium]|nr:FAD-binding protein [Flavobacteriales bacterium]